MRAWGFDYESLRQVKPDLIMLSTCLMGQSGPLSRFAGFGNLAAALCGFYNLVGWPDRPPSGPFSAYTDYIAPRFGACALMAALIHKKLTGEGQYIDQAQAESALHFLTLPIIDFSQISGSYQPLPTVICIMPRTESMPAGRQRSMGCNRLPHRRRLACIMRRDRRAAASGRRAIQDLCGSPGELRPSWTASSTSGRAAWTARPRATIAGARFPAHLVQDAPIFMRSTTASSKTFCRSVAFSSWAKHGSRTRVLRCHGHPSG